MHIEVAVHTDLANQKRFSEWINSRDYGSRPFDRVWMIHDIAIPEKHKNDLLADLKHYHKNELIGGFKTKKIKKILNFFIKRLGLVAVDLDSIEPTPNKWFEPIKWNDDERCTHSAYLEIIGGFKDSFDSKGFEEI